MTQAGFERVRSESPDLQTNRETDAQLIRPFHLVNKRYVVVMMMVMMMMMMMVMMMTTTMMTCVI